jgi:hypothetical protein
MGAVVRPSLGCGAAQDLSLALAERGRRGVQGTVVKARRGPWRRKGAWSKTRERAKFVMFGERCRRRPGPPGGPARCAPEPIMPVGTGQPADHDSEPTALYDGSGGGREAL